ncbi:MAG: NfeD family protein [Rhodospirillaceae bacterium]
MDPQYWLIIGAVLVGAEMLVPGMVLIWPGLAALTMGFGLYLIPGAEGLSWQTEVLAFAGLALLYTILGRMWWSSRVEEEVPEAVNRGTEGLIGETARLIKPISGGRGRIKLRDGEWMVSGPDLPEGTLVKITRTDGTLLHVEAVEAADVPDSSGPKV